MEAIDRGAPTTAPCAICGGTQARLTIRRQENGFWRVVLCGHFEFAWCADVAVAVRLLIIFLRSLRTPSCPAKRVFLRQEWLAKCFTTHQEMISRWERYWQENRWHALLSEHLPYVLTLEVRAKVLARWVPNFWLSAPQIQEGLAAEGIALQEDQINQIAQESGFAQVRQLLRRWAPFREAGGFQLPETWPLQRLFALVDDLQGRLQRGESLASQTVIEIKTLRDLAGPVAQAGPPVANPWQARVEQWLTGTWKAGAEGQVCCPHCGSAKVGRKSKAPRPKKYWGDDLQMHQVDTYQWYCKNPRCLCKTFTDLPWGLLPHSPFGLVTRLLVLGLYLGYRTTYRRLAWSLNLAGSTMYRWVHFWAQHPALFALWTRQVRCSGVVAVDEKWVKVRPADRLKPHAQDVWMYAYLAVDVYTYDLLHMVLSPVNDEAAARTFLLELRAKGYNPSVVVTDLRQEYGRVIQAVFPKAVHHECVFHALQNAGRQVRDAYGKDYPKSPEAVALKEAIYNVFRADTQKTARQRYHQVMSWRETYVAKTPGTAAIFDSLERHFPKLVNAVESELIPRTNNAVELVIRRFAQHYQNFCGFDGEATAQEFLTIFQMVYRITPFAKDNREVKGRGYSIRGKCPLELAGYDLTELPIARLFHHPLLALPGAPEPEVAIR